MVREGSEWVASDWEPALMRVAEGLKDRAAGLGVLASSCGTLEELYLAGRIARAVGSPNIDHRLRQQDFRDQAADPAYPALGMKIAEVDALTGLLVIGSNLRREAPILAHRVRRAALKGAAVSFLNPSQFTYLFPVKSYVGCTGADMVNELAAIVSAAAAATGTPIPEHLAATVRAAGVTDAHSSAAQALMNGEHRAVWLGALATRHRAYADLRALAAALAGMTGATLGQITEGANAAGAYLAGAVPHREAGGRAVAQAGKNAHEMLSTPLAAYLLLGGIEPSLDTLGADALKTLGAAQFVVAVTPFASPEVQRVAHVMLPMGTFAESSGTYVNCEGLWQSQAGAAAPVGESRPLWKILRVLGNLLKVPGFDYQSSEDVLAEVRKACESVADVPYRGSHTVATAADHAAEESPLVDVGMYQSDAVVRRAPSLQRTREGRLAAAQY
jgi:NADH-quinone oxidoreductase subunit G